MYIGLNIKKIRENRNMTQKKLSEISGVSEISIKKYETNDRKPKYENLDKLARALQVSINELSNTNSLSYELIIKIKEILVLDTSTIEKETGIPLSALEDIILNSHKDLPIEAFEALLEQLFKLDETAGKEFCDAHVFEGSLEQTDLFMKKFNLKETTLPPISNEELVKRATFDEIVKEKILDMSKNCKTFVSESDLDHILSEVFDTISYELFKIQKK